MGTVFKEFQTGTLENLKSTGVAAISGPIARLIEDEGVVQIEVASYDRTKKETSTHKYEVDLSEVGGVDPDELKKGMRLTCIGDIDKDNVIHAKALDIGNCYLTYKGYGIAAGETYYEKKQTYDKKADMVVASIRAYDAETDHMVKNKFSINGYGGDTKPQDNVMKSLSIKADKADLASIQSKYAREPWEHVPFDSCFVFQPDTRPSKNTGLPHNRITEYTPTEGRNAGTTFYSRNEYRLKGGVSPEMIGEPDMAFVEQQKQKKASFEAEHATVKEDTEKEAPVEEKEAPVANGEFTLDEVETDYGE